MAELTLETLAQRVAALEEMLARMRQAQPVVLQRKDWRRVIGMFPNDDWMKQVDDLGRQYRESQSQELTG